jgi:fibronectin type 3 domain-containing protein
MAVRKHVIISVVLLCVSGLILGCSEESAISPALQNEAPIIAPSNVRAMLHPDGVSLSWDASAQPNVVGYNVYRHEPAESRIGRLNDGPITVNRYIDTTTELNVRYEYLVTTVSAKGTESSPASVTINMSPDRDRGTGYDNQR